MATEWPLEPAYRDRFFVSDLAPASGPLKTVFIVDSPTAASVGPQEPSERIPFRGTEQDFFWKEACRRAGIFADWKELPQRAELLKLCEKLKFGILYSVQYPMDPKIETPSVYLGFERSPGEWDYKRVYRESDDPNYVRVALESLKSRLSEVVSRAERFVILGADAKWFTDHALVWEGPEPDYVLDLTSATPFLPKL